MEKNDQPDTQCLYVYCANNPVNYVDPSGHFAIAVPILVKLVLVGGVVIYVSYSRWKRHSPKIRYAGRKKLYQRLLLGGKFILQRCVFELYYPVNNDRYEMILELLEKIGPI